MKKYIIAVAVLLSGFGTLPAFAQTADDYGTSSTGTYCPTLSITMQRGARDISTRNQVSELQKFLADYYNFDPLKLVTGYFGRITQGYVIKFQKEQGLPSFGIAGQLTRAAIAKVCDQPQSTDTNTTQQSNQSTNQTTTASVSEQVKCIFNGATTEQKCWGDVPSSVAGGSPTRYGCSGVETCTASVKGPQNMSMTWGSSCGGSSTTVIDGNSEYANFTCRTTTTQTTVAATLTASPTSGSAPLAVTFRFTTTSGTLDTLKINFGDGTTGASVYPTGVGCSTNSCPLYGGADHIYTSTGTYTAKLILPQHDECVGTVCTMYAETVLSTTMVTVATCTKGDVDGDGTISRYDSGLVLKQVVGLMTLTDAQRNKADVNGDGSVNNSDSIDILKYVSRQITTFSACAAGTTPLPVVVKADPTLTVSSSPSSVTSGQSSTITWSSANTASCNLSSTGQFNSIQSNGSRTVSPSTTTTYTISCDDGYGAQVSKSVTVTVTATTQYTYQFLNTATLVQKMIVGLAPIDLRYDINKDGQITISDSIAYQSTTSIPDVIVNADKGYLVGRMIVGTLPVNLAYDINHDGQITLADQLAYVNLPDTSMSSNIVPTVALTYGVSRFDTWVSVGGNVVSLGYPATISARGFCFGTTPGPTDCVPEGGITTGVFYQDRGRYAGQLIPNTTYYYRAYATNPTGTGYSADKTIATTPSF